MRRVSQPRTTSRSNVVKSVNKVIYVQTAKPVEAALLHKFAKDGLGKSAGSQSCSTWFGHG